MGVNGGKTPTEGGTDSQNPVEHLQELSDAIRDLMKIGANRVALVTSISLGALGISSSATAQEVQVASIDSVTTSAAPVVSSEEFTKALVVGSEELTGIPAEMQWVESLNLADTNVADIMQITPLPEGIEALQQLASYSPEEQSQIASMYWGTDNFTDAEFDEYMPLIQELRVPTLLAEVILLEAIENGASSRHQRGIRGFLSQLREEGDLTVTRISIIQEYAPILSAKLPIVIRLIAAEEGLAAEEAGLAAEEAGLAAEEAGLAAEEVGLVDAQEGLRNQIRATEALRRAVEAVTGS